MPVSHSHQFLCVSFNPATTVVIRLGRSGFVTSQISCDVVPPVRSIYTLAGSPFGSFLPSQMRTICAPPCSFMPGSPGICVRYLGCLGSVTSTTDVPLFSFCFVIGFKG